MQRLSEKQEQEKQTQLEKLQKQLKDRRNRQKKDLHRKQVSEAKSEGLKDEDVPDMTDPSDAQQDKEFRLLALQQEKLLAELQKAYAEEMEKAANNEARKSEMDAEMEARMRALNLANKQKVDEALDSLNKKNAQNKDMRKNMKDRMKARKDRKRDKKSLPSNIKPGTEEGKEYLETANTQEDADREREEQALLKIADEVMAEERQRAYWAALNGLMEDSNKTQEERDKIMADYDKNSERIQNKFDAQKQKQQDELMARLAARKRMREELTTDESVHKELNNASKQVSKSYFHTRSNCLTPNQVYFDQKACFQLCIA
ncbi:uncharacterized protein LOC144353786 [Saccoglossus kowalevskii]